jgi:hypothetical protein
MTLEEKEEKMTDIVANKLWENNIKFTSIMTHFSKDSLLRDSSTKDVLITSFTEPLFDKQMSVITDPETLEMLYVRTDVMRFMEIDEFFQPEDDDDEE